ncbi:putative transposase-like protein, partial [Stegodyphus mimosarum]
MNFCRDVCVEAVVRESVMLDESKFSKRKYNRGKRVKGEWVFGGVERGSNVCFVEVVENRSAPVLLDVLTKYVLPGNTVIFDCWKAYDCLEDEGFVHLKVNHSITFKDPDTGAHTNHTNTVEGMWNCIKRNLKQVRKIDEGFDSYLSEFMWRRIHQENYRKLFTTFLDAIRDVYPPATHDAPKIKAAKGKMKNHEN